jgi:multiple sugar transport system substrate-binding protein
MQAETRLSELGLTLPSPPQPVGAYLLAQQAGKLLYLSGTTCYVDGELLYKGRVGAELTVEEGYAAARQTALNLVSVIKATLGDLDRVERVVKLNGYVNWAQPMARGTQSHWWFWDFVAPFCVLPSGPEGPDQYHGQLYFDPETMEPLVNEPCMLKGLELYKEMAAFGPPGMEAWGVGEIRSAFPGTANIAMTFEWGAFPGMCEDTAMAAPEAVGDCGTASRPGSLEVWDRENQDWLTLDEPNTAPLLNFGGWVGAVTQTSPNLDCAYDFLRFLNSPEISMQDVMVGDSGFNVYRYSHIENVDAWTTAWGDVAETDAEEYLAAVQADLENPNVLIDLRIPGKPEYVDTVLDLHVSSAISGEEDPAAALETIYNEWEKITDRLGRDEQKAVYRTMMGMD